MIFKPHKYQLRAIEYARERDRAGLLLRPGLGKTSASLTAFADLKDNFDAWRALVIAPLQVCHLVWPAETKKWDHLKHLKVRILHGNDKLEHLRAKADVYVINPAGLKWLAAQKWDVPDFLIVDEMTAFKHHTTVRAKLLKKIIEQGNVQRRVGLTGTPAPNGLEDLFGETLMLDGGERLGETLKEFRSRFWFAPVQNKDGYYDWEPTTRSEELIYKALDGLMLRLDGAGELDLPEVVYSDIKVEMPAKAQEQYNELRAELILELEKGTVTALNAGALISKCRQLAAGGIYVTPEGRFSVATEDTGGKGVLPWQDIHDAKLERLGELWEESGRRQMMIIYDYKHTRERVQRYFKKHFKLTVPAIGGGTSPAIAKGLALQWNSGELPVLLGHPRSMGHGLNLQESAADQLVWFDPIYDLELYEQVNGRLDRQGNKAKSVYIYHLLTERTVDSSIMRALRNKAVVQDKLLNALREDL